MLLWCFHGSHKAKDSEWCGLGILWGHHGIWPCLNEGKFRAIALCQILQNLLIWFSGQLQTWKGTCLKHPKSLKIYPTKPCVALSALHSSLHFKGLEMYPIFPWNQPSPEEHGMTSHPNQTDDKTTLLAFLGPTPTPGSQRSHPGVITWMLQTPAEQGWWLRGGLWAPKRILVDYL